MTSARATTVGLLAILMWSALAFLTVTTGDAPPFLLTALTFAIGGSVSLVVTLARGGGFGARAGD